MTAAQQATKTIVVDGQAFVLERRVCDGGCRKEFWVQPHSPQLKARGRCEYTCAKGIDWSPMAEAMTKHHGKDQPAPVMGLTDKGWGELSPKFASRFDAVLDSMEAHGDSAPEACERLGMKREAFVVTTLLAVRKAQDMRRLARYERAKLAAREAKKAARKGKGKPEREEAMGAREELLEAQKGGLSARQREAFDAVVEMLEAAAAKGGTISVSEACEALGLKRTDFQNAVNNAKARGLADDLERYRAAQEKLGLCRGGPKERKPKLSVAPEPEDHSEDEEADDLGEGDGEEADEAGPAQVSEQVKKMDEERYLDAGARRRGGKPKAEDAVSIYDDVQLCATENDIDVDAACRKLGIDYGEYLVLADRVEAQQRRDKAAREAAIAKEQPSSPEAKKMAWKDAVKEAVSETLPRQGKAESDDPRLPGRPEKTISADGEESAWLAVVAQLKPLTKGARERILESAAAFLGVSYGR